jgi:hypothetical protein
MNKNGGDYMGIRDHLRERYEEQNEETIGERIEREFIEQLNTYYAHPKSSFYIDRVERKFYEQKLRHLGFKPYPDDGVVTFGASGTDKCDREIYYRNQKIKPEKREDIPFRGRQRRQGTAIIDFVQLDILHMPEVLGDAAKFRFAKLSTGEYAFEDAAQRRAVFTVRLPDGYVCKLAITAKPDGILEYSHDGRRLLFEYKTKATGLRAMNQKLDHKGPDSHHLDQVVAESLVFGIREGIILYESTQKPSWFSDEDRKSVSKGQKTWADGEPLADLRAFYFCVTEEQQRKLLAKLALQARNVYENVKPDVTVEMTGKCGFCPYFGHCQRDLSPENAETLRAAEENYAKSKFAGKVDHLNLLAYLAEVPDLGK